MIDLTPILQHAPVFAMVLARLTGLFMLGPLFGSEVLPRVAKVAFVLGLSFALYPSLVANNPTAPLLAPMVGQSLSLWQWVPMVVLELAVGYVLGWAVSIPMTAVQMGGFVMDFKMGLSFAQTVNPDGENAAPVSQILYMLALAAFLILDGHLAVVEIMLNSFSRIELGGMHGFDSVVNLATGLMHVMMQVALRIAAPLVGLIFLQTVAVGFVSKSMPQLNILTIGLPLRILVGSLILFSLIPMTVVAYHTMLHGTLQELVHWLDAFGR